MKKKHKSPRSGSKRARGSEDRTYLVTNPILPKREADLLFMEWIHHLAQDRLGTTQWGSGSSEGRRRQFTFTRSTPTGIKLISTDRGWVVDIDDAFDAGRVHDVVSEALQAASRGDYGDDLVYSISFSSAAPGLGPGTEFTTHFMRLLGSQVFISGRRRLSDRVLLDFQSDPEPETAGRLFVPNISIDALLFVPGPCPGPFSDEVAWGVAEAVRVVCSFALGRAVDGPGHIFALSDADRAAQAAKERHDPSILTLARNSISLDIFGELGGRAGAATIARVRSSLTAYDAAIRQSNAEVATILFVSAIEALVAPYTAWRDHRVVTRFVSAVSELCADTVDSVVDHANVEEALGIKLRGGRARRRRDVLEQIYNLRSAPVHGQWTPQPSFMAAMGSPGSVRSALVDDLYVAALLAFIQGPRSFLWGHPDIDRNPDHVVAT
jgi:hypothetical protein